ncbi:MAG: nucleoside triphosphate pyrophosphatase [Candidatus Peribacteraceae bacterium]|jgi:septum formation protein
MSKIILASASPQRRQLLEQLGVPFSVIPSTVDEQQCACLDPRERAQMLARLKAQDVALSNPAAHVIGCDTLVVAPDGSLLEKPHNAAQARTMLVAQSGGVSQVHSAISLLDAGGKLHEAVSTSRVHFRPLSTADLDWWVSLGLWEGRSGAFQIDGPGQLLIDHLEGDWSGVVGLPIALLGHLLRQAEIPFL